MKGKKVIVSLIMIVTMLVLMVTPVFAATNSFTPYHTTSISNNHLNIVGSVGAYMNGRKLNLWSTTSPNTDQIFTRLYGEREGRKVTYFTKDQNGVTYAINRASYASAVGGRQAIMWSLWNGGEHDSSFKRPQNDPNNVLNHAFYSEGLHYSSDSNGATVYYGSGTSGWFATGTPW